MLIDRLRRISRDGLWVREIDGLRFVAIFSVFLFHLAGEIANRGGRQLSMEPGFWWLARLLGNGDRGVLVFFVISGMLLALPFARCALLGARPVSLRKYFVRRLTRLEPPYLVATLCALTMIVVYLRGMPPHFWGHVLATFCYQHGLVYGTPSPVNSVSWSLEVEIQFYVLAPLIMLWFRVRSLWMRRGTMLAAVVAIGVAQAPWMLGERVHLSVLYYLQYFIAGLLVADVFVLDLEGMKASWVWDAFGGVALATIFWPMHDAAWAHALLPLPIGLLCVAAMRSRALRRVLANEWIAVTGGMCYSIYLLHFVLIAVVFKVTRHALLSGVIFPVNLLVQVVATGVPVLLLCVAFFVLVERPSMDPNWPSLVWRRVTRRPDAEIEALDARSV